MSAHLRKKAFSLVEVLTVIAVIAILVGLTAGVGKYIKTKATIKLAESQIEIIVTAIGQYYDFHGKFPFEAQSYNPGPPPSGYMQGNLETDTGGVVVVGGAVNLPQYCSSEALYYFLSRTPTSKNIIETISNRLITNKDAAGAVLMIQIPAGSTATDLIRFVDPWGKELRYTYGAGDSFPVITSAGPDKQFSTGDDITSR